MHPAVTFHNVSKRYGRRTALDNLSLEIPRGAIFGLVGSNGAGKTTTLSITAGAVHATAGRVSVLDGRPFSADRHSGKIGLVPQDTVLPGHLPVEELLTFYAELQGMTRREAHAEVTEVLGRVRLTDRAASKIRTLSHGMRRRVMIAQAMLGRPQMLLMDEPLSGLDPREVINIRSLLTRKPPDQTIVISSHNLYELERTCDHVAFIENGRRVRQDTMRAVTDRSHALRYKLDTPALQVDALQGAVPGATLEFSRDTRSLVCRYSSQQGTAAEINAALLRALLDMKAGILSVSSGTELEDAYLTQSPEH
jgi:ABC-type multidrug transport system ATPase subunit